MSGPNPSGLCMCGCGERTVISSQNHSQHGWVKGAPLKYVKGHSRRKSPVEYIEQDCGYLTPCWVWQRATTTHGYGQINLGGFWARAHRVVYERHKGPIPEGLTLDHLCSNPSCVNPDHLEPVTNAENTRRGRKAKLTHELVAEIRASDDTTAAWARRLGLHYDTIWCARMGKSWA